MDPIAALISGGTGFSNSVDLAVFESEPHASQCGPPALICPDDTRPPGMAVNTRRSAADFMIHSNGGHQPYGVLELEHQAEHGAAIAQHQLLELQFPIGGLGPGRGLLEPHQLADVLADVIGQLAGGGLGAGAMFPDALPQISRVAGLEPAALEQQVGIEPGAADVAGFPRRICLRSGGAAAVGTAFDLVQ